MTASQINILFSNGVAKKPYGLESYNFLKSLTSLFLELVDIFYLLYNKMFEYNLGRLLKLKEEAKRLLYEREKVLKQLIRQLFILNISLN